MAWRHWFSPTVEGPTFHCFACRDVGFVVWHKPSDNRHPGELVQCPQCNGAGPRRNNLIPLAATVGGAPTYQQADDRA